MDRCLQNFYRGVEGVLVGTLIFSKLIVIVGVCKLAPTFIFLSLKKLTIVIHLYLRVLGKVLRNTTSYN